MAYFPESEMIMINSMHMLLVGTQVGRKLIAAMSKRLYRISGK
jgi:hypothetical protein